MSVLRPFNHILTCCKAGCGAHMPTALRMRRRLPFKQRTKWSGGEREQACILGSGQAAGPTLRLEEHPKADLLSLNKMDVAEPVSPFQECDGKKGRLVSWSCHKKVPPTGALKTIQMHSLTVLGARNPKPRHQQGYTLSEASREGSFFASSSFWWWPAVLGIAWIVVCSLQLPSLQPLPPLSQHLFSIVSVSSHGPFIRTLVIRFRAHSNPV